MGGEHWLEAQKIDIHGHAMWVRGEARAQYWDRDVCAPILAGDEYELDPLVINGHQLQWVLDIGGHVGSFTRRVKAHWPAAKVIACEPEPESAALFRLNTQGLADVWLHEKALLGSDAPATVAIRQTTFNPDANAAATHVSHIVAPLNPTARAPTAQVQAISVTALLEAHGNPDIDLLKIDCEGSEAEILEALADADLMRRVGWIRGEWHFYPNIPRIEAALSGTHVFHIQRGDTPWGGFIAHRRLP